MDFEYDSNKSFINKQKHGIDFEEAQYLWSDSRRIEIEARTVGEVRKLIIAELNDEVWSAIFTIREERIRIISVRKSRKNETSKEKLSSKGVYYNASSI